MTTKIMLMLMAEYAVLVVVALVEKRWSLAVYWMGAMMIQVAVIVGMK